MGLKLKRSFGAAVQGLLPTLPHPQHFPLQSDSRRCRCAMPELALSPGSHTAGAEHTQGPDSNVPSSVSTQAPDSWQRPGSLGARAAAVQ